MIGNKLVLGEKAKEMMRTCKFSYDYWKTSAVKELDLEQATVNEITDYLKNWVEVNGGKCPYLYHPEIERYINNRERNYFNYIMISLLIIFLFVWLTNR